MIFKQMFTVTVTIAITETEKMLSYFFALNSLAPGSHCLFPTDSPFVEFHIYWVIENVTFESGWFH